MSNIIEFPKNIEDPIDQLVDHFRDIYKEAGLTPPQISRAMVDLEPIVREILPPIEFTFDLSGIHTLSDSEVASILLMHENHMQTVINYYWDQLWISLCGTAKWIGRNAQNNT
jgi:uncharacterized membrane protein